MTPVDEAFAAMKSAYAPPQYVCAWRSDLWDIAQWITYCAHCEPVALDVFQGMQGEAANKTRWMPAFDDETVSRAVNGMPECGIKKAMCDWLAGSAKDKP